MNIVSKIRTFVHLDIQTKLIFVEAFLWLGWARILLIMKPFNKIALSLGVPMEETLTTIDVTNRAKLIKIYEAIRLMSNYTWWESKCLVRAIAGMRMLNRRGLNSTLYLGTAKDKDGKLLAHAWLRSGSTYITGAEEKDRFTVVGKFASRHNILDDSSTMPKELTLLLLLLNKRVEGSDNVQDQDVFMDIDWAKFLELARHHRVYPLVYKKLKDLIINGVNAAPKAVIEQLRRDYHNNTFQMLQLSGEMEWLCKILNEHQIRSLFLKGPVVAADLYGSISLRTSCDLDVLIPFHDLARTEQLLSTLGYEKDDYIQTVLGDWKWRHHHVTFFHADKGIKLEIHWRLGPGPAKELSFEALWERRRVSTLTSYPIHYLGREHLFLFLVTHGARHGWSRLRWLVDIERIIEQQIDWKLIKGLLREYQSLQIGGQALLLVKHLLNGTMTEQMETIMAGNKAKKLAEDTLFYIRQIVNLHTLPLPEEISKYHKRYLFVSMTFQQKIIFLLSFLYPYPEDVVTLPLPKKLHFLYFLLRPLLWIFRKTTKMGGST
jgi:hypothetical protein